MFLQMKNCLGCMNGKKERLGCMTQKCDSLSQIWADFLTSSLGSSNANPSTIYFERKFLLSPPNFSPLLLSLLLLTIAFSCLSIILVTWVLPEVSQFSHQDLCKTLPHSLSKIQPFLSVHATEILVQSLSCHLTSQAESAFLALILSE